MKPENRYPFNTEKMEPIGRGEGMTELYELRKDPNKIIREIFVSKEDLNRMIGYIECHRTLLDDLSQNYGIVAPKTSFVVGEAGVGSPRIFLVTDKVDGSVLNENLDKAERKDAAFLKSSTEDIIISLADYLKDKISAGEDFMGDIFRIDQYMYGSTNGSKKKNVYLVDLETFLNQNQGEGGGKDSDYDYRTDACAAELIDFIYVMERKTGRKFTEARKKVGELIEYFRETGQEFGGHTKEVADKFYDERKGSAQKR